MAWSEAVLAVDSDLTAYERKMPDLAKSIKSPQNGSTAYDNKRLLAKRAIGQRLVRMQLDLDSLTADNILALNEVAVFKELELIFRDMSDRNDSVSEAKAKHYAEQYEESWQDAALAIGTPQSATSIGFIPMWRA
jgi:hypothetical protein